ncbi:MAG: ABC transporter permease [Bacteroidetes bacterium]|nr:ABC transporter permease [Bacteroidota bacterium]
MTYKDSLALSWKNIKGNKLRTSITVVIIALGIFALILIVTAISAASNSLTDSFSTMGANSFSIRYRGINVNFGRPSSQKKSKKGKVERKSTAGIPITVDEVREFKERYNFPGTKVGITLRGPNGVVVNTSTKKTNPENAIIGGDENFVDINGYSIAYGRTFTQPEVASGSNICILGSGVAKTLFPANPQKAVDAIVNVDHIPFRVIGVLEDKSSSAFFNTSKIVITPYNTVRKLFTLGNSSYNLAVMVPDVKVMDAAISEATGIFRQIRKLNVKDADNFFIDKSDSIANVLLKNLSFLELGTIGIALITLITAAIGLMNIMLVAVNERTKEIGLIKALGGTRKDVRSQFLFESFLISVLGAVSGIVAGVLIGNIVALLLKTGFVVPWGWVLTGIIVCGLVGLAAGLYPAIKAAKLDPIKALRYE